MAALPYMQLYIADYLADTMHLSTEEHGAYLLLMFNYWQTGKPIPKNRLAKIARMGNERWISVESSLKEFFNDNGVEWVHERIDRDLDAVRMSLEQKSAAGRASAEARKHKKGTERQRAGNTRSTVVNNPLKQDGNGKPTNKDPDNKEDLKDKTPHIAHEENLPPAENNGLPEYLPGIDEPIGKFPMFSDWRPSLDFRQRAALAGVVLDEDYQPTELAGFVMYWQPEGKAFHQLQWEQKFARHIQQVRVAAIKQKTGGSNAGTQQVTGSGESRAMQKFREARAQRYGADAGQIVGGDDRDLHGSLDNQERGGAIASVGGGDWTSDE
ncbi:DUF1376 domain-containing protein [Pectobacterium brasiliense]|uniref:DUF1376 domain-containing protein n=1 Tax=Pectobacterium brasiliense TaxID=180957 RepID=A0A433NJD5_9GAMM|nr:MULTISPECIES: DUF1376 domain-containing protein [Pectobacterium]GKW27806.1 hypothetical protein PEC331060_09840 [Pectobacterium carotovorum subsp. carotovorum]MBN3046548.1 DUF1376 domain-containing protein [Pectobacterium brasiliense]MBN3056801.1 DUF1376 domain-containing protein [Pectobacterium brasiliense]MBN3075319.1 DUF1376 domain-containing protein [Pectobacterium brasiliense]MBN3083555.1 DUF1376 domain-containing protein [Pectobacterium brasiliense]